MKLPYCEDTTFQELHPVAVKILIYLCSCTREGRVRGLVGDTSDRLHLSERSWRRGIRSLVEAGVLEYRVTCDGYDARVRIGTRFTWLPSFDDDRLAKATPRACKVLVAICRCAHNTTRSIKMRLKTIAAKIGRCSRTVQLGLRELGDRCILTVVRTGRSNWFAVRAPEDRDEGLFDGHEVAHRAELLLRLLSSTTSECLSKILHRRRREEKTIQSLRHQWISPGCLDNTRRGLVRRLIEFGVSSQNAAAACLVYTPDEVSGALELAVGRRTDDPAGWIDRALRRGMTFT